jgi:DNA (cytosine-5)-methyltransferase 1
MTSKQRFRIECDFLIRTIVLGEIESSTKIRLPAVVPDNLLGCLERLWQILILKGAHAELIVGNRQRSPLALADLFCGCGGFSLGVSDAAKALGFSPHVVFAADLDQDALAVYRTNFSPDDWYEGSVSDLVDFQMTTGANGATFKYPPALLSSELKRMVGKLDVLVAGPPCQGHSNLNNHTRRDDPRNLLYLTVPAIAVATKAKCVIVENVPDVINDSRSVVSLALDLFRNNGYFVASSRIYASHFGTAQSRRRHIAIAVRKDIGVEPWFGVLESFTQEPLALQDVIDDLEIAKLDDVFDSVAEISDENKIRIDHLFDNGLYDLPNEVRPDCHKNGHTYKSVYGRLKWEDPSPTITTGFLTPGRGRYIHPHQRRTLTPHEAARIQAFPDSFEFRRADGKSMTKTLLSKLIGQAVPPPLGHAAALVALGSAYGNVQAEIDSPVDIDQEVAIELDGDEVDYSDCERELQSQSV